MIRAGLRGARVTYLDSVRGIAATVVVFHHCLLTFRPFAEVFFLGIRSASWARFAAFPPFSFFWDGRGAVLIFFVLSGYVLALMLEGQRTSWLSFAVKRCCRIYLPYAVAIAVALLLMTALGGTSVPGTSPWFAHSWSEPLSARLIAHHILMSGNHNTVDIPIWSLVHELRVSLIFPALMLLVIRVRSAVLLPSLLAVAIFRAAFSDVPTVWAVGSLLDTAGYLFLFAAGASLAHHRESLRPWMQARSRTFRWVLIAATFAGLSLPPLVGMSHPWWISVFLVPVEALSAVVLLLLIIGLERPQRLLSGSALVWYGGISYSLYLTHMIVLLTMVYALGDRVPLIAVIAAVPFLAVGVAAATYSFVERPAIRIGRALSRRVDTWYDRRKPRAAAAAI